MNPPLDPARDWMLPEGAAPSEYPTFQDIFKGLNEEAFKILVERQRKYGPENIERLGLYGVYSRLAHDKLERLRKSLNGDIRQGVVSLSTNDDFDDESWEDTLFDIANYALIMVALGRGHWGFPLREEMYAPND